MRVVQKQAPKGTPEVETLVRDFMLSLLCCLHAAVHSCAMSNG
jgi:hypothetical protein